MPCKNSKEIIEVACSNCGVSILKQRDSIRRWSGLCRRCATNKQIIEGRIKLDSSTIHSETGTPLWNIWRSARKQWLKYQREEATLPYFEKWNDYTVFKEWALSNGYIEGLSLLRKIYEKGWTPDNCYFYKFNIVEALTKTCFICGNTYVTTYPNSITCSRKCAAIHRGNQKKDKYINNPNLKERPFINRKVEGAYKRAKEKNMEYNLTPDFIYNLYLKQNKKCALTNKQLTFINKKGRIPTNLSIDRIDSSKGYTEDNVQLVCSVVNLMKLDLEINEFKEWCQLIVNTHE
jgi:hypothetical protein